MLELSSLLLYAFSIGLLYLVYRLFVRNFYFRMYYRAKGVPTNRKWLPILEDTKAFMKAKINDELPLSTLGRPMMNSNPYSGMIYLNTMLIGPTILVNNPELADELFSKMGSFVDKSSMLNFFGGRMFEKAFIHMPTEQPWKQRRVAYQPAFAHSSLKIYTSIFKECLTSWTKEHEKADRKELNMEHELFNLTLDVIGKAAFGNDFAKVEMAYLSDDVTTKTKLQTVIGAMTLKGIEIVRTNKYFGIFPALLDYDFPKSNKEYRSNIARLHCVASDIINKREVEWRNSGKAETNLLDMLLKHREEGLLSQDITVSEAILFIVAGHETTSRAMTSFIYRTHQNPEVLAKIRSEIKRVIFEGNNNTENIDKYMTYEKLQELEYTTMCIKESLRIDPPAFVVHYDVKKTFTLNGIKIYKGTRCAPDVLLLHNNPLIWHSPREFIPERFDPTSIYYKTPAGEKRHPTSFIPFAAGPRNCIGQNFAMMEMKYLIVYLLSHFSFELTDEMKNRTDRNFALGTNNSLPLTITRIHKLE